MALETSLDKPASVRVVAKLMSDYIDRLGPIWVEGQISELTRRPGASYVYLTLRDTAAEVTLSVRCGRQTFDSLASPITEGARVVVWAKFDYYLARGSLSLVAKEIRPVGLGEMLARLEQRRRLLAAEGLFDAALKKSLPFLPQRIGLVVGRDSAAERDVVENARRRWPGVDFRIEHCLVQGNDAARQMIEAVSVLDRDPAVDVIIVARGGGSLEDLLPFYDEGLVRAVAACTTPVVSAIGHEQDQPLIDLVADLRASTPTDAAKQVVPDVAEEAARVHALRGRSRTVLTAILDRERHGLAGMRSRPVLADPQRGFDTLAQHVDDLLARSRRCLAHRLERSGDEVRHQLARVRALSPLATLERGYAVLQTADGAVVTDAAVLRPGDRVDARVATGRFTAVVDSIDVTTNERAK